MLGFLATLGGRLMAARVQNWRTREQWFLAWRPRAHQVPGELSFRASRTLVPPTGTWYADPFLVDHEGRTFLLFEQVEIGGKGVIAWVELSREGEATAPRVALERPTHLSYPMVFGWEDELFMIPETRAAGRIELYRADPFPSRWTLERVLLDGVEAVDTTVLERDGRWWLFTCLSPRSGAPRDELHLFHASSPLGPWSPHPRNPVITSARQARPAGHLFEQAGQLIRPSQDGSQGYGYAIMLSRVDVLTPEDYQETTVRRLVPDWQVGLRGTHTWNVSERFEVTDGLRLVSAR